jgi:hypothetical protein
MPVKKHLLILLSVMFATSPVIAAGSAAGRAEGQEEQPGAAPQPQQPAAQNNGAQANGAARQPSFAQAFPHLVNGPRGYYNNGRLIFPIQLCWWTVFGLGSIGLASLGYAIFGGKRETEQEKEDQQVLEKVTGKKEETDNTETVARGVLGCAGVICLGFLGHHIKQVKDKVPLYEFNPQGFHKNQEKIFSWNQLVQNRVQRHVEQVETAEENATTRPIGAAQFDDKPNPNGPKTTHKKSEKRTRTVDYGRTLTCVGKHDAYLWQVHENSSSLPITFNDFVDVMEHYRQNPNQV